MVVALGAGPTGHPAPRRRPCKFAWRQCTVPCVSRRGCRISLGMTKLSRAGACGNAGARSCPVQRAACWLHYARERGISRSGPAPQSTAECQFRALLSAKSGKVPRTPEVLLRQCIVDGGLEARYRVHVPAIVVGDGLKFCCAKFFRRMHSGRRNTDRRSKILCKKASGPLCSSSNAGPTWRRCAVRRRAGAGPAEQAQRVDLRQGRLDIHRAAAAQSGEAPRAFSRRRWGPGPGLSHREAKTGWRKLFRPGIRRSPACPRRRGRRPPGSERARSGGRPASRLERRVWHEAVEAGHHLLERNAGLLEQHPGPHRQGE